MRSPVRPSRRRSNGLRLYLDEIGWQVDTRAVEGHTGVENVPVTTESHQAEVYADVVRRATCDPDLAQVNIFGFRDDAARAGFQAGLYRVDGTPRASAGAVQDALAEQPTCTESEWKPARSVLGVVRPRVTLAKGRLQVELTAAEGATARACLIPGSHTLATARRMLASRRALRGICTTGVVQANRIATLSIARRKGAQTLAVRLAAETNSSRATITVRPVR